MLSKLSIFWWLFCASNCQSYYENDTAVMFNSSISSESSVADIYHRTKTLCDYYTGNSYLILPSQKLVNNITIQNNTIDLIFKIKLHSYCNKSMCNIIHIGTAAIHFPSLSINADNNYFQISITDNDQFNDIYTVPNADIILPVDNQYHTIFLRHDVQDKIFSIDNTIYYHWTKIGNKQTVRSNHVLPIYISNPWDGALNGSITDICVVSTNKYGKCTTCIDKIECGDSINATISDIAYYYFKLQYNASVLFRVDASYDLVLYLDALDSECLGDFDKDNCYGSDIEGLFEQLYVELLHDGEYALGIGSVGDKGYFNLEVICKAKNGTSNNENKYVLYPEWEFWPFWSEAEYLCENTFGTTLATVETEEDMEYVMDIIVSNSLYFDTLMIGKYKDIITKYQWSWFDGTLWYVVCKICLFCCVSCVNIFVI